MPLHHVTQLPITHSRGQPGASYSMQCAQIAMDSCPSRAHVAIMGLTRNSHVAMCACRRNRGGIVPRECQAHGAALHV